MKLPRLLRSRVFLAVLLFCSGGAALAVVAFLAVGGAAQPNFRTVDDPMAPEHRALIAGITGYQRPEDSTYLTFPEWYLVFNPQEYAQYLGARKLPSGFPYFQSVRQLWSGYAQVYGITKRHYPFNPGDHLMEAVICTSFTVEYLVKGVYENTVGRLSEWVTSGATTEEDAFAATVAKDYGEFIPTQPWYDFPFGARLRELWSSTGFWGAHFLRKNERKAFLSLEYGVKAVYAGVIRLASHSVYGLADDEIYASIDNAPDAILELPGIKKRQTLGPGSYVITLPHYQGFTDTVPRLAHQGVHFLDIAGNDEILLTVIAPAGWQCDLKDGNALFAMSLLTGSKFKRIALQAPVKSLSAMLQQCNAEGVKLEHAFDY